MRNDSAVHRVLHALRALHAAKVSAALLLALHMTARHAGAQAMPLRARVVVHADRVEAAISPLLYGQFVEFMYQGVKGGLGAELLRDRGFEEAPSVIGLPRPWDRYPDDRNDDYGIAFRWDDSVAYATSTAQLDPVPKGHALRVDASQAVLERHGVQQAHVAVRGNVGYHGSLWLRTTGYTGRVLVALEQDRSGGAVYAESAVDRLTTGEWRRYDFTLRPRVTDALARFVILFPGTGRVWVDQASLMPDDAVEGVRADVAARVAALHPAFIRWPGGNVAQDYHWRWGVGPRDERPQWANLSWHGEAEPGDIGTAELIAFSRRVGAEPSLTVNVEGRGATPEEAAAWVEYCNGAVTTPMGRLRAAHGHPAPYGVRYWEVGNEIWGDWVRGHSDAATYARNYRRYHDAMRAVDSTIRFIAVGDNDMAWNRTVLGEVGPLIDYLAIHHYYGGDSAAQREPRNLMARPIHHERLYHAVDSMARALVPGHPIRLAINEWGLAVPERQQYGMDAAVHGARLMNVFERSAPLVGMSAVSDLVNGWPGGIIQAARDALFVSPLYWANVLWATHLGTARLMSEVTGPAFDSPVEGPGIPYLDVVASRAGSRLFVKIVNTHPDSAIATTVVVRGGRVGTRGEWTVLAAPARGARNGFAMPDVIRPRGVGMKAGSAFTLRVPASSVSVVEVGVE